MKRFIAVVSLLSATLGQAANFTSIVDGAFADTATWDLGTGYPNLTGPDNATVTNAVTHATPYAPAGDFTIRGGSVLTLDQAGGWNQSGAGSWIRVADQNSSGTLAINAGVFSNGTAVNLQIGGFTAGANGLVFVGDGVGAVSSAVLRAGAQPVALGRDIGSTGTLVVAADGAVESASLHLGADKDGNGTGGSGVVTLNGGRITISGVTRIGRKAGSEGSLVLNDGVFRMTGSGQEFWVGEYGRGFLLLTNSAQMVLGDANHHAGVFSGTGTILVAGSGVLSNEAPSGRNFSLGGIGSGSGQGALTISNAGRVVMPNCTFQAGASSGRGLVSVNDDGYLRINRGWIGKDANSTGRLEVTGNGRVEVNGSGFFVVGENGPGSAALSGNASLFGAMGNLAVGAQNGGRGSVLLTDSASITNGSSTTLGNNAGAAGAYGSLRLEGSSTMRTVGNTVVGQASGTTGELFLVHSGVLYIAGGALSLAPAANALGLVHAEAGVLQINNGLSGGAGTALLNLGGATLRAGGNGSITAPITLTGTNGSATMDTGAFTLQVQSPVGGEATLTKTGSGKLAFHGASTFTNLLTIAAGTLGGTGSLAATATLADGTFLDNTAVGIGGTLTLAGLSLAAGATVNARLSDTGTPAFVVTGTDGLATAGTNRVNIAGSLALGTYDVLRFAGNLGGAPANFQLGDLPSRVLATLTPQATGAVQLTVTGVDRIRWTGAASDAWDTDTTTNWLTESASVPTAYLVGDTVLFDDAATGPTTVTVASAVSPASVIVSNDILGYRITGAPVTAALAVKRGGGVLELAATNTLSHVVVESGTLRLLANSALGGALVTLGGASGGTNGAALLLNGGRSINSPVLVSSALAGPAVLGHDNQGGGFTELTGAITLQRDVVLTSGNNSDRLHFGGAISGTGHVTIVGGARITANGNNTFAGDVTVSGTGTIFQTIGGSPVPDTADVTVEPGAIFQLNTSEAIDGLLGTGIVQPLAANPALTIGAGGASATFSGLIRNNGANYIDLVKTGSGTAVFDTVHTFTGQTTVNGGELRLGVAGCFTNGGARIEALGTLELNGFNQSFAYLASGVAGGTVTNSGPGNATLTLNQVFGASRDFYGSVGGDITVLVTTGNNTAAQSFRGVNTYTGKTIVRGGQLRAAQDAGLGAVPAVVQADNVTLDGGTLQNYDSSPVFAATRGIALTTNGGAIFAGWSATNVVEVAGPISGPGSLTKSDGATLLLSGSNTFSGDTVLSLTASGYGPGTIRLGHTHALQNSTFDATGVGGNGTLDLNGLDVVLGGLKGAGSAIQNFAGHLTVGGNGQSTSFGGLLSGSGSLAKTGAGTLTLSATNTYDGPTDVSNGTLAVHGALTGTGTVTVVAGATLTGTASLQGSVVVDGTLAPGTGVGSVGIGGDLALGATALLVFEVGGTGTEQSDTLSVGGNLTYGGTLSVSLTNGYAPALDDTVVLVTAAGVSGAFQATNLPALAPGLAWNVVQLGPVLYLQVVAAPIGGYDLFAGQVTNAAQRGYADDPDGDGYANLLEYVTGGSPTNTDLAARMSATRTNSAFALRFSRATNAVDATLIVEGSYMLADAAVWTGIATNSGGLWGGATNVSEEGTGSPVEVTVRDPEATATNRFLRLRVTRP